jgi:hypothetical protein
MVTFKSDAFPSNENSVESRVKDATIEYELQSLSLSTMQSHPVSLDSADTTTSTSTMLETLIKTMETLNLGTYTREHVSNAIVPSNLGRQFFDAGLRLLMSYQHEMAAQYFNACVQVCPHMALAHGLLALSHGPNYNFKGDAYYETACHSVDVHLQDMQCVFPSQHVADRHSAAAIATIEELKRQHRGNKKKNQTICKGGRRKPNKGNDGNHDRNNNSTTEEYENGNNDTPVLIADVEAQLLSAIRILTGTPGVDPGLSYETVGRPYADAMRKVYQKYPNDPDIVYFFAESLMVLNAWELYEYPSGKPLSPDVDETRTALETALQIHPNHPGLIHMYVHLSEMSAHPDRARSICEPLRTSLPHAGHLIHMPTHIDVLVGEYDKCVRSNLHAIEADMYTMRTSPATAGRESFYFGYIVVRIRLF